MEAAIRCPAGGHAIFRLDLPELGGPLTTTSPPALAAHAIQPHAPLLLRIPEAARLLESCLSSWLRTDLALARHPADGGMTRVIPVLRPGRRGVPAAGCGPRMSR